ncbi:MAG: succinate dehydrogenase iron-sulfur subunit [endosymbiont of Seepiophila jonesi]|uniref:succinate dehydrogenase n=1 Tax=endosymbiont of Lamellibrachia luymesi TaxID=2200907 RepID=A0A370E1C2_9GAMM|nr:MAG: succinate dehydrogenase iron-sulfur subunit [endosymbiont of Lamellibrachia luymesi]RDH94006.1 MAG: succinate dehydrogenase iron-sulfur subunit [endosymbiont of Seepiophila jonesi]
MNDSIELRIRRQDRPETQPYWQTFRIPHKEGHNIVSALMMIRNEPVTSDGELVEPVVWEFNCMEEVCGACSMIINGRPQQACSALVDELAQPIVLEPLGKFPVVRDLLVNRSRIFEGLKQVKAWVEIDGAWDVHQGAPRISPQVWSENHLFSRCMSCGCCMEACPQFGPDSDFLGPAVLGQVRLMNGHPTGTYDREARLHAIMGDGGLSDCGNAQNCVQVCPKEIPLTTAIGELGRQVTRQLVKDILG